MLLGLGFHLKLTTPFCYLNLLKDRLPNWNAEFWEGLELILEYASMSPKLTRVGSLPMLLGVFLWMNNQSTGCDQIEPFL